MYEALTNDTAAHAAVAAVAAWVDVAADTLCEGQLRAELAAIETVRGQLDVIAARHFEVLDRRSRQANGGRSAVSVELGNQLGLSAREIRRRAEAANTLGRLPGAADALAKGAISAEHVDVLAGAKHVDAQVAGRLVDDAKTMGVDEFRRHVRHELMRAAGDDGATEALRQHHGSTGSISASATGMTILHAELDPARGDTVRTALHDLCDELWRAEHPDRAPSLTDRPAHGQRLAHALVELCRRYQTGTLTEPAAARPDLTVLCDYRTLTTGLHDQSICETTWGTPLAPATVRRLACTATIIPVVLDGAGQPLDVGRAKRLATPAQRRAVIARDRRCVFGCHSPPAFCEVHHNLDWDHGGRTDLDNLSLVCKHHHHLVHEGRWTLRRVNHTLEIRRPDGSLFDARPPSRDPYGAQATPITNNATISESAPSKSSDDVTAGTP